MQIRLDLSELVAEIIRPLLLGCARKAFGASVSEASVSEGIVSEGIVSGTGRQWMDGLRVAVAMDAAVGPK